MSYATVTVGSSKIPWPLLAACIAAAPLLAVVGLRTVLNRGGPQNAMGDSSSVQSGPFMAPVAQGISAPSMAIEVAYKAACQESFGPSPMINRAPPPQVEKPKPDPVVDAKPVVGAPPPPIPTLTLTSIMSSKGQPVAIINGKLKHVGDSLPNGFSVKAIDSDAGTVEVGDDLDRHTTLMLKNRHAE